MTLTVSPSSVAENAGAKSFSIGWSMSGAKLASSRSMRVAIGSATATATLPANQASASGKVSLSFTPSDDNLYSGNRTVAVTGNAGDVPVTGTSITIVEDEDPPKVSLSASSNTVNENGDALSLTVSLSEASGKPVTVDYETADGTALSGSDYTAVSGTLNFAAGQKSKSISISITNDSIDEDNETFTVSLSDPSGATLGSRDEATVTIIDNDLPPKVSLSPASKTVGEGAGTANFTVRLSKASGKSVTLEYATTDVTASSGSDYTAASEKLVFTPGESTQTISVSIKDDSMDESNETFMVSLSSPSNTTLGSPHEATVTITDNDPLPKVSLSPASKTVGEGAGKASLTVSLNNVSGKEVKVKYATAADTASSGSDYTAKSGTLTYAPGQEEKTISISILEDSTDEPDEAFTVDLSSPSNATLGSTRSSTVTIRDNDVPSVTVSYASAAYQAIEGGSAAKVTVNLSARPGRQVVIPISVARKAGASSADYSGIPSSVTFGSRDRTKTFTVTATDDTVDDDGEWLALGFGALPDGVTKGSVATERVDLIDDDHPDVTVSYASATYEATEGGSAAKVTVKLSAQPERQVVIPIVAVSGGGATSEDYELSASSVTFSATQTSRTFTVTATDDTVDDDGEWLALGFGALPDGVTKGSVATERVDLIDDDVPSVSVSYASEEYQATEGGSSATVTVNLSARPGRRVTIPISATHKAGASSADYSGVLANVTFGKTDTSKTFSVTATDDAVDDDGEWLELSFGALPDGVTKGSVATERVDLIDNDPDPTVTLALSPSSIREDGGVSTVTASLSHASSAATTVSVSASPVSPAVAGDFTQSGITLTIAAGDTDSSGTVSVTANDNAKDEPNRTVTVSAAATNTQGIAGDPSSVTLTITDDDDAPTVSLSSSSVDVDEGAGSVSLSVRLSEPSGYPVTVKYETADGTAKAGSDYSSASGTLTFSPGQAEEVVDISVTDDTEAEANETFTVALSGPKNATLGSAATATVTITDNDSVPEVSLSASSAEVDEGDGAVRLTVRLSEAGNNTVTVDYTASDGAPVASSDFASSSGTLTFAPGETSKAITVAIVDDDHDEPNETFTVKLSDPVHATLGNPSVATVTITDNDDAPSVSLSLSPASIEEGESASLTATLSRPSSAVTQVQVRTGESTGLNYELTIPAGETDSRSAVTLTWLDDDVDAPDRRIEVSGVARNAQGIAGDPPEVTLIVRDNDAAPSVTLVLDPSSIAENGGVSTVTARLSHPSSEATEVDVSSVGVAPASADDFTQSGTSLVIPALETASAGEVAVAAVDNAVHEPDKQVTVSGVASNTQGIAGDPPDVTLTIKEDDSADVALALSVSATEVAESAGAVELTVTGVLAGALAEQVTAPLSAAPGEATEAEDFTASAASLAFTAGATRATAKLTVTLEDDRLVEGPETIVIGGSALGLAVTAATVTITDDDAPAWRVALTPASIVEAGGRSAFLMDTGGVAFEQDQALALAFAGAAQAGVDFSVTVNGAVLSGPPYALQLPGGALSAHVMIVGQADDEEDPDETAVIEASHNDTVIGSGTLTIAEGVCSRTPAVRDALMAAVGATACEAVTAASLAGIAELDFSTRNVSSVALKSGDLSGLARLERLIFRGVALTSLPADAFAGLASLKLLNLKSTGLSSLPLHVFGGLGRLERLTLENNPLGSLSAGVFRGLGNLRELTLRKTGLVSLPAGLFTGLNALEELNLRGNRIVELDGNAFLPLKSLKTLNLINNRMGGLPAGLFVGLTQLQSVRLEENSGSPFALGVTLEKAGQGRFRAVLEAGAPFPVTLPVTVSEGGEIAGGAESVSIAVGRAYSETLIVSRKEGASGSVTLDLGPLPAAPGPLHQGYELAKSLSLPLTLLAEQGSDAFLSVADAVDVQEGEGAQATFTVTLNPPAATTVKVDYASVDGSAKAGEDYQTAGSTLTFAPGETSKTVVVAVLDDAVDEARETFKLPLSNARGAGIADGEATAAIVNSDPLPQAWLGRFAGAVAGHVADGIGERLSEADRGRGLKQESTATQETAETVGALPGHQSVLAGNTGSFGADGLWPAGRIGDAPHGPSGDRASRALILGRSFATPLGDATDGRNWTLWGRAMATRFQGAEDRLVVHGDVTTYMAGMDTAIGRWRAGLALARSSGEGGYRAEQGRMENGTLHSRLTSIHPYAGLTVNERLTAWGLLGYGWGDLALNRGAGAVWRTGASMAMAAAGARGVLVPAPAAGGFEWAVRADALVARMASAGLENAAGRLADAKARAGRLRLMMEGERTWALSGGRTLTPNLAFGLRRDAGEAGGMELGGGLRFADAGRGLSVELKARTRLSGEGSGEREWGASAAVRLNPPASGRGLMLTVTPVWGLADESIERFWTQPASGQNPYAADHDPTRRLNAEIGYALDGPEGRGVQTPFAAIGLSQTQPRTLTLGWRLSLSPHSRIDVEASRNEYPRTSKAHYGISIRGAMRW